MDRLVRIGLIGIPIGVALSVIFGLVRLPDIITTIVSVALFSFAGILAYALKSKKDTKNESRYIPNPQEYWSHIEKLRQSLEDDIKKNDEKKKFMDDVLNKLNPNRISNSNSIKDIPDFYTIIKNSPKKTEYLQHLFTYHPSKLSIQFAVANMVDKDDSFDYHWKKDGIDYFNKSFQHIYEIMSDSKPLIGLCDGCKMDYYGEDRKNCLLVLDNFHKDKDGMISNLFKD